MTTTQKNVDEWTVIIQMGCGQYNVGCTKNVFTYLEEKKKKYKAGYFHTTKNNTSAKIVFVIQGDYAKKIHSFGTKQFVQMMKDYDPVNDALNQLIS